MQISKLQNNYNNSFRGLDYKKVLPQDVKKYIKPYLQDFKNLAEDVNIELVSGTYMQKSKTFMTPRPTISINITPKDEFICEIPSSKHTMILSNTTESEDLFDLVKTIVRNIFY